MDAEQAECFKILGRDDVVYGPVELPALVNWVQEERVDADTWVYVRGENEWRKAVQLPELRMFFDSRKEMGAPASYDTQLMAHAPKLKPGSLRRIKVFAGMSNDQLSRVLEYIEVKEVKQFAEIVRQGQPGDAMYLILQGEVRVRMMIAGKESTLVVLASGDFFGEISLFDHGSRSADVVANEDSVLLRIGAGPFERMVQEAPNLAAPFLFAMGKTLTSRIRADNKRFSEGVTYARLGATGEGDPFIAE
jgi:CRP/FNR family transcriptional regulator, cyclic AMP receptor protein